MDKDLKKRGIKESESVTKKPKMVQLGEMKREVYNPKGEHLGKIEDVILDLSNKRISFGILSFGGIFGLGDEHYAIPWDMLKYDEKNERFQLDIDKEKLTEMEPYDPSTYPFNAWAAGRYGHLGYTPW